MGILHEYNVRSVIAELRSRGLSAEQIDKAMQKMVGGDWKDISVSLMHRRLCEQFFLAGDHPERFLDDLEALVKGRLLMDALYQKGHRWGTA